MNDTVGFEMAAGKGQRLQPLTDKDTKCAIMFGGGFSIIDFNLNNAVNAGIETIFIPVQTYSQNLLKHITRSWPSNHIWKQSIEVVPSQMKDGERWYHGNADGIYQNLDLIDMERFRTIAIFAGDQITKMDIRPMKKFHREKRADFTIAALTMPVAQAAGRFGVLEVDAEMRVFGFNEKPRKPHEVPGMPGMCLVSLGNYLAELPSFVPALREDASNETSAHDFGHDVIPLLIELKQKVFAFDFGKKLSTDSFYWKDVGTIKDYWSANMDLPVANPGINLHDEKWPIRSALVNVAPAKFVSGASVHDSIVCGGCIIDGGDVTKSVLSYHVSVGNGAVVTESVIFQNVKIGSRVKVHKAIIQDDIEIPDGEEVGVSETKDKKRGLTVVDGITVVPKGYRFSQ